MVRETICFVIGAAVGFGAATLLMKSRYESMVEEETKSAMEWVKSKNDGEKTEEPISHSDSHAEIVKKADEIAKMYSKEDEGSMNGNTPYRIAEGDFVIDDDEYGKVSLELYTEDETVYEDGEPISNIDEVVGRDNLDFLMSIDDDVMYVRNETYMIDYEICKINGSYSEGNDYVR